MYKLIKYRVRGKMLDIIIAIIIFFYMLFVFTIRVIFLLCLINEFNF